MSPLSCSTGDAAPNQHCYFTCEPGFRVTGNPVRTCLPSLKWNPLRPPPSCEKGNNFPYPFFFAPLYASKVATGFIYVYMLILFDRLSLLATSEWAEKKNIDAPKQMSVVENPTIPWRAFCHNFCCLIILYYSLSRPIDIANESHSACWLEMAWDFILFPGRFILIRGGCFDIVSYSL